MKLLGDGMRCLAFAALAFVAPLLAQTPDPGPFEFAYDPGEGQALVSVQPNGNILFGEVGAGTSKTMRLAVSNRSQSTWTLSDAGVIGDGFSAGFASLPIAPQSTSTVDLTFRPEATGVATAVLTLGFADAAGATRFVTFQLSGSAPLTTLAASWSTDGQTFEPVRAGGVLRFRPTLAGSQAHAVLRLTAVAGERLTLDEVRVNGGGFRLLEAPAVPATLDGTHTVDVAIQFEPSQGTSYSGAVNLTFGSAVVPFAIDGPGTAADLEVEAAGAVVTSGSAIAFPAVQAGAGSSTVEFRVRNRGNATGRVLSIAASGGAFRILNAPSLPMVLVAGEDFRFSVEFAPSAAGDASGTLRIDGLTFPLSGPAFEQKLGVTLTLGDRRLPAAPGIVVLLPNTPVGSRLDFGIEVTNTGDRTATISSISLSGQSFTFRNLPALPATVAPGQSIELAASFTPGGVTTLSAILQLDSASFTIRGAGGPPAQLSSVRITGASSPLAAGDLASAGVELDAPYAIDLNGTLMLEFSPTLFVDDPSILFVNGRKSIEFRVPAGSTRAVFPGGAQTTSFQSGTVAGIVTLSAQLAVGSTPVPVQTSPTLALTIPAAAPKIRSVRVTAVTATYIELQIAGFSTARSVSRLRFDLTGAPGGNLRTEQVVMNVEDDFNSWFASSASRAFGGQFTTTVRLQVNGDVNAVESVGVSATNSLGTSPVVVAGVRPQ